MKPVDVEIGDVLEDIRSALLMRETGRPQTYRAEVREVGDVIYLLPGAWQNIQDSLTALNMSLAQVLEEAQVPIVKKGPITALKRLIKRVILKAIYWYVNPVEAQLHRTHSATARALNGIADQLKSLYDRMEILEKENIVKRLDALEADRLDERLSRIERSWRQDAIVHEDSQEHAYSLPIGKDRITPLERRLPLLHFDYYWFESIHRGDRELIKRRLKPYVQVFNGCRNVLDIGCGWGEFLELLKEKGIGAYGIDIEGDAVRYCRENGLDAKEAEAIEHLSSLPRESLDGVMLSQVAEHLTPSELIELLGLAHSKMKPKSPIVIETPNPQCLLIFASFFYADLSHVQPIHPETMRFLLQSAGFQEIEINFTNPVPRDQRLSRVPVPEEMEQDWVAELNRNFEKLNSVLFGYMDYAAIAKKG